MIQCNILIVKLPKSQLIKFKWGIKNGTKVTLNLSLNVIGDFNDVANFPHKLLLADTQTSRFRKTSANNSSAHIKFSKIQLSNMVQSAGFLGIFDKIMGPTLELTLEVLKSLNIAKDKNAPNGFLDAGYNFIDNKTNTKPSLLMGLELTLKISEIKGIIKAIKSLANRGIFLKRNYKTTLLIKKGDFSILLVH